MTMQSTDTERERYSRQMALPEVGEAGQLLLAQSRVLIVGAGGLGAPVALYLAAAGVGRITLVDDDRVELSNLHRQVIYTRDDLGLPKAEAAARRLRRLNDAIEVTAIAEPLGWDNAQPLIGAADLVLDCCDNFPARYLINDVCHHLGKPWLFAAVHRFRGQLALFTPETACFRCLYPDMPVTEGNCSLAGVLGTVPGVLGLWQANEALKHLLRLPESRPGSLWHCDVLEPGMKRIRLTADPECRCVADRERSRGDECPLPLVPEALDDRALEVDWRDWRALEEGGGSPSLLIDTRDEQEHRQGNAGGIWLPWVDIPAHLGRLGSGAIVGLYCQRGQRSLALARRLRAQGFERVFSLRGGVESCR